VAAQIRSRSLIVQKRNTTLSSEQMGAFERDPDWRPLSETEIAYFTSIAKKQHWTFMGETTPDLVYWRKPPMVGAG